VVKKKPGKPYSPGALSLDIENTLERISSSEGGLINQSLCSEVLDCGIKEKSSSLRVKPSDWNRDS